LEGRWVDALLPSDEMSAGSTIIVCALIRREGRLLLVEELET
jgi:hypothetical protein